MAHDPSLAYADYFAAGGGAVAPTLVPEVDAEGDGHLYGAHQPGVEVFGARGLVAHGEAALGLGGVVGGHFVLGDHAQQQHRQGHHGPLTSLSLQGPAQAASLLLHHHQPAAWPPPPEQGAWHLCGSRFLRPTQQLLREFCSLPEESTSTAAYKPPTKPGSEDGGAGSSSLAPSAQIQAMDAAELQRLKAKLYAMLEEVDRRHRRYREQMRAVAGSFEAVAGERAAAAYTKLASRTISKHFRSLRDGIMAQMQAVRKALSEKDTAVTVIKGETTPRLRVIDQCLRQHKAYQAGMLESQPWRPQRGLPERAVSILRAWLFEHFLHPYPSDMDKHILARQTGLSRSQVSNWFINARVRLWKPMVEEMYAEEMKDQDGSSHSAVARNPSSYTTEGRHGRSASGEDSGGERKPTRSQLVHEAGSLASVVSIGGSTGQQSINFGMMDHLDFDAYNDDHAAAGRHEFGGGGGTGVSLTLGLQQHADDPHGGVNVAYAPAPAAGHAEFLFMAGSEQQMVVGGGVHPGGHGQFGGGMQGDAVAASHYHRGLGAATGFQLLHDLAG